MLEPSELGDTLEDHVLERALTLRQRPSETIVPARRTPDSGTRGAVTELAALAGEAGRAFEAAIQLERTIGQGGMGIVRLATQVALGRKVAVKTLRDGINDEAAVVKLLREAWVTGSLEHPNVAPIYDVGLDTEGRPLIVLKRIEGTEWSQLMHDPAAIRERFGIKDVLGWNLDVFMQVCNAMRFAHSRGIVHRDIKPENVMIGEFGEVYVLDWGIAVSMSDDGSGRFPLASEALEMAGTPHYMAPEMLGGPAARITQQTDIYLLGAVMHEIVTGKPPHDGDHVMAVVTSVAACDTAIPDHVPGELAAILRRAMSREPGDRHADADELRMAVRLFLDHRGSALLAADAQQRLEHLLGYIAAAELEDEPQRQRLYNLFTECRFGFREAMNAWPDNPVAVEGLRSATIAMVEYELSQDDPRAAAALATQLPELPAGLGDRIEEAIRRKAAEREEMEEFAARGRQEDQRIGRRTRAFLAGVLGLLWTLSPLTATFMPEEMVRSYPHTLFWPVIILVLSVAAGFWARESLRATAFNRRLTSAVGIAIVGQIFMHLGSYLLGLDPVQAQVYPMLVWAVVAAMVVVTIDLRLIPVPLAYTAAFIVAAARPDLRFYAMSAGQAVMMVNAIWLWRRPGDERRAVIQTLSIRPPPNDRS